MLAKHGESQVHIEEKGYGMLATTKKISLVIIDLYDNECVWLCSLQYVLHHHLSIVLNGKGFGMKCT